MVLFYSTASVQVQLSQTNLKMNKKEARFCKSQHLHLACN